MECGRPAGHADLSDRGAAVKLVDPVTITDAVLTSSNVAEPSGGDPAAWAVGTTYALGATVYRATTHRVYRSLAASNVGNTPETSPTWWQRLGSTNRWGMFDELSSSLTARTSPLAVTLAPGIFNAAAVLGMAGANTLTLTVTDPGSGTVYSRTEALVDGVPVLDWWGYFHDPIQQRTDVVLFNVLSSGSCAVNLTLTGFTTTATVGCATFVVGTLKDLGITLQGVELGIVDYSRREVDEATGITLLEQRAFSKRYNCKAVMPDGAVDAVAALLTRLRARPVLWVGDNDGRYSSLLVWGFYRDWSIELTYADRSMVTFRIEGFT